MTKSVRSRLKAIVSERRQARRHRMRRAVSLVAGITFETERGPKLITGRTRDASQTGLSLSLPVDDHRQRELLTVNNSVRLVLALPKRNVNLSATIIYSHLLDATDPSRGMLVGLQITQISPEDRRAYEEYVESVGGKI